MEHKNEAALHEIIRESMKGNEEPSPELNNRLKISLYQREAELRRNAGIQSISLWFIPMILNFVTFSLFAILSLVAITNPYLAKLAAGICCYISFAGIVITAVGVRRAGIKQSLAIQIQKRGAVI